MAWVGMFIRVVVRTKTRAEVEVEKTATCDVLNAELHALMSRLLFVSIFANTIVLISYSRPLILVAASPRFVKCEKCLYFFVVMPEIDAKKSAKTDSRNFPFEKSMHKRPPPPPKKVPVFEFSLFSDFDFASSSNQLPDLPCRYLSI